MPLLGDLVEAVDRSLKRGGIDNPGVALCLEIPRRDSVSVTDLPRDVCDMS